MDMVNQMLDRMQSLNPAPQPQGHAPRKDAAKQDEFGAMMRQKRQEAVGKDGKKPESPRKDEAREAVSKEPEAALKEEPQLPEEQAAMAAALLMQPQRNVLFPETAQAPLLETAPETAMESLEAAPEGAASSFGFILWSFRLIALVDEIHYNKIYVAF